MTLRIAALLGASLLFVGCADSHGRDSDAGPDGSTGSDCAGPRPTGCAVAGDEIGCCEIVDATCVDGAWDCPDPTRMGWACESYSCGTPPTCPGPMPECFVDLGDECCGAAISALCAPPTGWQCPGGTLSRSECGDFEPSCGGGDICRGLDWLSCLRADDVCQPLYDDLCCSSCTPGPCADCTMLTFHECVSTATACSGSATCGQPARWACSGAEPDCSDAFWDGGGTCSEPGCVVRLPAGCEEGECEPECVPMRIERCLPTCDIPAPPCPDGYLPEAEDGCYTGACIHASVCEVPIGP